MQVAEKFSFIEQFKMERERQQKVCLYNVHHLFLSEHTPPYFIKFSTFLDKYVFRLDSPCDGQNSRVVLKT